MKRVQFKVDGTKIENITSVFGRECARLRGENDKLIEEAKKIIETEKAKQKKQKNENA